MSQSAGTVAFITFLGASVLCMVKTPQCKRCRMGFETRELLQDHSETMHGDYQQALNQDEYLAFRSDRGDDLTTAREIPIAKFMSVSKLKSLMRAGKAESDLYAVRAGVKQKRRKRKANCPTCGEPVDTKFGKKYHRGCRPSAYERKRPDKPKTEDSAPIIGKRRRRCAAPDCDALFYPESKRQRYHSTKCADKARSKRFRLKAEPQ